MNEKQHYIDNKKFSLEMKKYVEDKKENPNIKPSNYIGECIISICTRLMFRPNFINYPYRDEFIEDAIENCIRYLDRYNHEKSKNAFSYFSQIAFYAAVRRIHAEKEQVAIKAKIVQNTGAYEELIDNQEFDDEDFFQMDEMSNLSYLYNYTVKEKKKHKKEHTDKKHSLENFLS